jgi:hypothetical protein
MVARIIWVLMFIFCFYLFFCAFAKLRNATISFRFLAPTDFHEIWHMSIFRKSFENIQVSFTALHIKKYINLWSYMTQFFLEWKMFQTRVVEKIKTHILFPITFFSENRAVYEIMWKNIVQPGRPHGARALLAGSLRLQTHTQNL